VLLASANVRIGIKWGLDGEEWCSPHGAPREKRRGPGPALESLISRAREFQAVDSPNSIGF
jgi:hypothetical protein